MNQERKKEPAASTSIAECLEIVKKASVEDVKKNSLQQYIKKDTINVKVAVVTLVKHYLAKAEYENAIDLYRTMLRYMANIPFDLDIYIDLCICYFHLKVEIIHGFTDTTFNWNVSFVEEFVENVCKRFQNAEEQRTHFLKYCIRGVHSLHDIRKNSPEERKIMATIATMLIEKTLILVNDDDDFCALLNLYLFFCLDSALFTKKQIDFVEKNARLLLINLKYHQQAYQALYFCALCMELNNIDTAHIILRYNLPECLLQAQVLLNGEIGKLIESELIQAIRRRQESSSPKSNCNIH